MEFGVQFGGQWPGQVHAGDLGADGRGARGESEACVGGAGREVAGGAQFAHRHRAEPVVEHGAVGGRSGVCVHDDASFSGRAGALTTRMSREGDAAGAASAPFVDATRQGRR